mmetsp:Transcript_12841/g.10979  ORF Transcript_12841/g.10979 Transcript_12841/m.10979 type:complete len:107 (+) Transcript_12841:2387-2707(+)
MNLLNTPCQTNDFEFFWDDEAIASDSSVKTFAYTLNAESDIMTVNLSDFLDGLTYTFTLIVKDSSNADNFQTGSIDISVVHSLEPILTSTPQTQFNTRSTLVLDAS